MKKTKKGFTLVELVIVIAVIAILASVLIPTFAGILERANESARVQAVTSARDELLSSNMDSPAELQNYVVSKDGKLYTFDTNGSITLSESEDITVFQQTNNVHLTVMDPSNVSIDGVIVYIIGEGYTEHGNESDNIAELTALKNEFIEKYDISSNYVDYFIVCDDNIYVFDDDELTLSDLTKTQIEINAGYFYAERIMSNDLGATFYYVTNVPYVAYRQPGLICDDVSYTWQEAIADEKIRVENNVLQSVPDPDSHNISYLVLPDNVLLNNECYGIYDFGTVYNGGRYIASASNPYKFLVGVDYDFDDDEFNVCETTEYVYDLYFYNGDISNLTVPDGIKEFSVGSDITKNLNHYYTYEGVNYIGNEYTQYIVLCSVQNESETTYIVHQDTKIIGENAFYNLSDLAYITLPEGLLYISSNAFAYDSSLSDITIPGTCSTIGRGAFSSSGLETVTINNGVKYIEGSAFAYCYSLRSCTMPDTLVKLGDDTFYRCSQLNGIQLPETLTYIGGMCFDGCYSLTSINIPSGIKELYIQTFLSCPISSLTLPSGITRLYQNSLPSSVTNTNAYGNGLYIASEDNPYFCLYKSALDSTHTVLTIHEDCKLIYPEIFAHNTYLTEVNMSASVIYVGNYAFYDCDNLTTVTFEDGFNGEFVSSAFQGCALLSSADLPEDYTGMIGYYMFAQCPNLTSYVVPVGVNELDMQSFYGAGIQTLEISVGDSFRFEYECLKNCNDLTTIIIRDAAADDDIIIGYNAFYISGSNVTTHIYTDLDEFGNPLNSALNRIGQGTNRTVVFHSLSELDD